MIKKNYHNYKPSSVKWLGDVPEHWHCKALKYVVDERNVGVKIGPFGSAIKLEMMVNEDEGFFVYGQENVIINDFTVGKRFLPYNLKSEFSVYNVLPNDLLVTMMGTIGRCQIVPENIREGIIDSHLMRIRLSSQKIDSIFFRWYFAESVYMKIYLDLNSKGSIMQGLNGTIVKNLIVPLPPLPEQQSIATFLDRVTGRIDSLIKKKKKLIELLKEKRSSMISRAVTKGLDSSVTLKPSGVEWLGDVPEHWKILPIKRIVSTPVTDGPHETPEIIDEGIPFISAEAIRNNKIDFNKKRGCISESEHRRFCMKYHPQIDDIYMIKSGATTGNLAIVETDEEFSIWSPLAVIRVHIEKANAMFILSSMNSKEFQTSVQLFWSFGTQQNIGMNVIQNLVLPIPPLPEQQAIAAFLDNETAKIDKLVIKVETAIDRLKEYRTSLISSAVTGKIDVRDTV